MKVTGLDLVRLGGGSTVTDLRSGAGAEGLVGHSNGEEEGRRV